MPTPVHSHASTRRRVRRPRQQRNWLPIILSLILLALTLAVAGVLWLRSMAPEHTPSDELSQTVEIPSGMTEEEAAALRSHYERKENFFTILVSGVDNGNGGSDTNILVAVDVNGGKIYGVSIPRDTKAMIQGKYRKINYAYAYGGMETLATVVSAQLGIPVDYTVEVDLQGFVALVDAIDGVDFNVPVNMDYDDPYQDLSIHFTKGMQHLTGEEALGVVRFRHNNDGTGYGSEDLGRMQTQQNFLKAVAKQTLTVSNLDKIDDFVRIFQSYVNTDLSLGNLAWLGTAAINIGVENIDFSTLPNEWVSPYIYLDKDATLALVNEHLNPYIEDRTAEDLNIPS